MDVRQVVSFSEPLLDGRAAADSGEEIQGDQVIGILDCGFWVFMIKRPRAGLLTILRLVIR